MTDTDERDIETPTVDKPRANTVTIRGEKGMSRAAKLARVSLSPEFGAMTALAAVNKGSSHGEVELDALYEQLLTATRDESATGTDRLMTQAMVLDRLFTHLTAVAMRQEYVSQIAPALTLAMRAQAQCRATLQAVSDIRHPRQYVGTQHVGEQYNSGGGHQQVNRDGEKTGRSAAAGDPHADTGENRPNELSEGTTNELHPNGGAPSGVEGTGDALEAVGTLDGTANGRG